MKNRFKPASLLVAGLVLASTLAHAQLITVNTAGRFNSPTPGGMPSDEFSPGGNAFGSVALFRTGVLSDPVNTTLKTGATFQGIQPGFEQSYTLGAAPVTFSVGNWILSNGVTNDGTTEDSVRFDFRLNVANLGLQINSAPFIITLDGAPGQLDNVFTVTTPAGGNVVVGGNAYDYSFTSGSSFLVAENNVATTEFLITFRSAALVPVPEPSTYGLLGAAVLIGGAFLRRRFGQKAVAAV